MNRGNSTITGKIEATIVMIAITIIAISIIASNIYWVNLNYFFNS